MDIMEIIQQYAAVPVILACFGIGFVLKHAITKLDNKYIPLIEVVLGVLFNAWIHAAFTFDVFLVGVASGLAAVGFFQFGKQLFEKKE